jgi:hypothetical protein
MIDLLFIKFVYIMDVNVLLIPWKKLYTTLCWLLY